MLKHRRVSEPLLSPINDNVFCDSDVETRALQTQTGGPKLNPSRINKPLSSFQRSSPGPQGIPRSIRPVTEGWGRRPPACQSLTSPCLAKSLPLARPQPLQPPSPTVALTLSRQDAYDLTSAGGFGEEGQEDWRTRGRGRTSSKNGRQKQRIGD